MVKIFNCIIGSMIFISGFFCMIGCNGRRDEQTVEIADNTELKKMVAKDQAMRQNDTVDMEPIDKEHRLKVLNMLANGQVKTIQDKLNASLIMQHTALTFCNGKLVSISPENYYLAYQLAKSVVDSGHKKNADWVATTYDRYLLYTNGYQKYGTQRVYDEKTDQQLWAPIDSTTTDEERAKYNIKPLKELLKEYKMKPFN